MLLTRLLLPRGMTRSMYRSCERSDAISDRVETVWMYAEGSCVVASADWITRDMTFCVWMDSLPPLRMAAFPAKCRRASGPEACGGADSGD